MRTPTRRVIARRFVTGVLSDALWRATLPARGRDLSPASLANPEAVSQMATCGMNTNVDAAQSLPFTGRVARKAGRVG